MVNVEVENGTACYDNLKSFDVCIQGKCQVFHKLLLVYTWRHCGHVGGVLVIRTKHFSPLGTMPYFHVNSSRKNSILLTTNTHPTWPPCHVVANQENAKVIYFVSSNERRRRKQRKKSKKELVYEQNNLFTRASRFLIHSLTSLHDSWCDVLWGTFIYDDEFSFLFLKLDKVRKNSTPGESAYI